MSTTEKNDVQENFLESYIVEHNIRTTYINGTQHFVAKDVARSFGYAEGSLRKVINQHCFHHKTAKVKLKQAAIPITVIDLSDLCLLALRCRLKPTEDLRYWILNEVIKRFSPQQHKKTVRSSSQ